jgi:hypothetical protein
MIISFIALLVVIIFVVRFFILAGKKKQQGDDLGDSQAGAPPIHPQDSQ